MRIITVSFSTIKHNRNAFKSVERESMAGFELAIGFFLKLPPYLYPGGF
jgi:hypothetical protein